MTPRSPRHHRSPSPIAGFFVCLSWSTGPLGFPGIQGPVGPGGWIVKCPTPPKSAFAMKLSDALPKPPRPQPIIFKESLYDQQGHFDLTTGEFKCTRPGVYNFGFGIISSQSSVQIRLMRYGFQLRDKQIQAKHSYRYALGTISVRLETGDKACLESMLCDSEAEKGTTEI